MVERRLTDALNVYLCSVLNIRGAKSGERIHANRVVQEGYILDDIPENTVTFAHEIENKWWIQAGEESAIPNVDFTVDLFDRADSGTIGQYWNNSGAYRVYGEQCYSVKYHSGDIPYIANLSNHNKYIKFNYQADEVNLLDDFNWLLNNTYYTTTYIYRLFAMLLCWDIEQENGVYCNGWLEFSRDNSYDPLWIKHAILVYWPGSSDYVYNNTVTPLVSYNQLKPSGTIQFTVNENIISCVGDPFVGSLDIGGVYLTAAGLDAASTGSADFWIIDNFKAWISSIPEPPDESGHGRYINGQYVYSDKYHAGGGYNPDA